MSAFKPRDAVVVRRLILDLSLKDEKKKLTQEIACSLFGVEQRGRCLFVGSDEGPGFEWLQRTGKNLNYRMRKSAGFFRGGTACLICSFLMGLRITRSARHCLLNSWRGGSPMRRNGIIIVEHTILVPRWTMGYLAFENFTQVDTPVCDLVWLTF